MKSWSWFCAAVQVLSFLASADPQHLDQTVTSEGRTIPTVGMSTSGNVSVIVQFRELPLFARDGSRVRADSAGRSAAMRSFDERFATFTRDLEGIDRELAGGRLRSNADRASSRITQRYSRVFAGAAVSIPGEAIARIERLDYVRSVHLDLPVRSFLDRSVSKIKHQKCGPRMAHAEKTSSWRSSIRVWTTLTSPSAAASGPDIASSAAGTS